MKKLMTSIAAASILSTASFAATAMSMNQNGLGDYLVVPAYFANSAGWTTNIKVTNTDTKDAVVAKIVFREGLDSIEVRDFLLYLSPGDVWEGKVSYDGNYVRISSTDDSTVFNGIMTSSSSPLDKEFSTNSASPTSNQNGYVEVFASAKIPGQLIDPKWSEGQPLDKVKIYKAYNGQAVDDAGTLVPITSWLDVADDLFSVATVDYPDGKVSTTINAVAFSNFSEDADGRVDNIIAGQNTIISADANGNKSMTEKAAYAGDGTGVLEQIDALLMKSKIYVNFSSNGTSVNETILNLTTPTKKYWDTIATSKSSLLANAGLVNYYSDVRTDEEKKNNYSAPHYNAYVYSLEVRDQMENRTQVVTTEFSGDYTTVTSAYKVREFSQIAISSDTDVKNFKDGIASVNFNTSVPVIPVVMSAVTVGGADVTNAYTPAYK